MVAVAELEADPYPVYARLRRSEPVSWIPEVRQWLVTGWDDVHRVLTDVARFTTDQPGSPMLDVCGGTPLLMREGESHRDVREALRPGFGARRVGGFVDAVARPVARGVAGEVCPAGRADLAADYFEPVAAIAVAELLGLGRGSGAETLRRWGNLLTGVANDFGRDPAAQAAATADLAADTALTAVVRRLRAEPDGSVLSRLLHAHRPRGDPRPDADVVPVLKHLALSVVEPGWLAGWTLAALWSSPAQLTAVRDDPALLGAAVSEALRWSGPVGVLGRRTRCTTTLGGREIPADSTIAAAVASANRDEAVFTEPDRFDLRREVRSHLGFGTGPHHCPASALVPALARTALEVLFEHLPSVQPAPGWQLAPHGWKLRLPGPLDAVWDARPS
ncbi:cytochrome P450 [Amycolatopsis sp. A133]|uniref:cytochrome P450 n=1 Tax=Amycolatopsis sp. A133 TaxID=3064472 RepID=UPI0027FFB700|nr:cytochrome P450 [Amycolatopsis sp. A133]MDQ7807575.1 cytochrome P450 [Amycolatopsis sp. A133]